ncbi:MAG: hypothetical protein ACOYY2_12915 [Actinomycetota bacterium]
MNVALGLLAVVLAAVVAGAAGLATGAPALTVAGFGTALAAPLVWSARWPR